MRQVLERDDQLSQKLKDSIKAEYNETPQQYLARIAKPLLANACSSRENRGGPPEMACWATIRQREVWVWRHETRSRVRRTAVYAPLRDVPLMGTAINVMFWGGHYDSLYLGEAAYDAIAAAFDT